MTGHVIRTNKLRKCTDGAKKIAPSALTSMVDETTGSSAAPICESTMYNNSGEWYIYKRLRKHARSTLSTPYKFKNKNQRSAWQLTCLTSSGAALLLLLQHEIFKEFGGLKPSCGNTATTLLLKKTTEIITIFFLNLMLSIGQFNRLHRLLFFCNPQNTHRTPPILHLKHFQLLYWV